MQHVTFFRGGTLVTLRPARVEQADLIVADGRIVKRGGRLNPPPGAEIVDVRGRILMPGFVDAHVDLNAAYARLLPQADPARLAEAATEESLVCAAFAVALEAVRGGVTTLVVQTTAPRAAEGSLTRIRDVLATLGVRFAASYASSENAENPASPIGASEARLAAAFGAAPRMRYLIGADRASRLSDAALGALAEFSRTSSCPPHLAVGFDGASPADAHAEIGRLFAAGFVWTNAPVVCGPLVAAEDLTLLRAHKAFVVRTADVSTVAEVASPFRGADAFGTGSARPDALEALRATLAVAAARGHAPTDDEALALLDGGQKLASRLFGLPFGTFDPGAAGDITVFDYKPATPLTDETVARHVLYGLSAAHVQHVLVDGRVVLRDRQFHRLETGRLVRQMQRGAFDLVVRATGADYPGIDRERDENAVFELAPYDQPPDRVRSSEEASVEFEELPAEDPPAEVWRIRGGDRGSDFDGASRVAAPVRALRAQPAAPIRRAEPVAAAPVEAPAPAPAPAPSSRPPRGPRGGPRAEAPPPAPRIEPQSAPVETPAAEPKAAEAEPTPPPAETKPPAPPAPPADPFGAGIV